MSKQRKADWMSNAAKIREMLRRKCSVETISKRLNVTKNRVFRERWGMRQEYVNRNRKAAPKVTDSMGGWLGLSQFLTEQMKGLAEIQAKLKALGY